MAFDLVHSLGFSVASGSHLPAEIAMGSGMKKQSSTGVRWGLENSDGVKWTIPGDGQQGQVPQGLRD